MLNFSSPTCPFLLLFLLGSPLLSACEESVAPVIDDKPSLYEQQQQNNGNQVDAGGSGNSDGSSNGSIDGSIDGSSDGSSDGSGDGSADGTTTDGGLTGTPALDSDLSGCRTGDVWEVTIHSVPEDGEGCQNGGGAAQSDTTHKLTVVQRSGGGLTIELTSPPLDHIDYIFQNGELFEEDATCRLMARVEFGINFPNDSAADNQTTQTWLGYDYDLTANGSTVNGNGTMTTRWLAFPDASNLDQDTTTDLRDPCSEPLELNGTVLSQ